MAMVGNISRSVLSHPRKWLEPISPPQDMDCATITKQLVDEYLHAETWIFALIGSAVANEPRIEF
jgi:hypothetical protein